MQAAVGSHCLDCVKAAQPALATRVRHAYAAQHTIVTNILIAINALIFVWMGAKSADSVSGGRITREQFDLGLNRTLVAVNDDWYRLITSGFIHFGLIHVGFNMFMLWQLGQVLERSLGPVKFTLLYFASLLGGSAGVLLLTDRGITGGASGAVFGLMAAATISLHQQGINVMQTGLGRTLAINLVLTFMISNVSIGGHLGGAVAGAAAGFVMLAPRWKKFPTWATYAAPIVIGLIAIAISYAMVQSVPA